MKLFVAMMSAAALGVTAYLLSISWGGPSWVLDTVSGALVLILVLARRDWAALTVALAAAVVAHVADQPQEPGPAAAIALAYLAGRAVARRQYRVLAAAGILVAVSWVMDGFTAVTVILTVLISGTSVAVAGASRGRPGPRAAAEADGAAGPAR